MSKIPGKTAEPEWKQTLLLVEQIGNESSSKEQCRLIADHIHATLNCSVEIWLLRPFYPLPNETVTHILTPDTVTPMLQRVISSRKTFYLLDGKITPFDKEKYQPAWILAFPLIANNNLLGVIQVEYKEQSQFSNDQISYLDQVIAYAALGLETVRQTIIKNWRFEQLNLVRTVSNQIANFMNLDELCHRVTELIRDTFKYYNVAIFIVDQTNNKLRFRANSNIKNNSTFYKDIEIIFGQGIVGNVALSGKELLVKDVRENPVYYFLNDLPETLSEFAVPLRTEGQIHGVLDVQSDRIDGFHEIDMLVLRSLADNVALALEGAQHYSEMKRRADQIASIFEITYVLNSKLELDDLFENIVKLIQTRFGYLFVHIFTVHPGRRKAIFRMGSSAFNKTITGLDLSYDLDDPVGIIPWVARNGKTLLANDVDTEPLYRPSSIPPADTRAELAVPLNFANETMGVLDIQSDQQNAFDNLDLSLFETLASNIGLAIRNANLFRSDRWRLKIAESFYDVARLMAANAPLPQILDTILQRLDFILPCDATALWLIRNPVENQQSNIENLQLAATTGSDQTEIIHALENSKDSRILLEHILHADHAVIRKPTDPLDPIGVSLGFPSNYSSISTALRIGNRPVGLLTLAHQSEGKYGGEAASLISTFASYAAIAIQNSSLLYEVQEQAWVSTVLLQVAETTQASNTVEELLSTLARITRLLLGIKQCIFFLRDESRQAFIAKSWYGVENIALNTEFLDSQFPIFARIMATFSPVIIQDIEAELNIAGSSNQNGDLTQVLMPLNIRGKILGAFFVAYQNYKSQGTSNILEEQTSAILNGISHQASVALENLLLTETQQEEAYVTAVLLQVAQAVVSQNNLEDIFDNIVNLMPILVGISACVIYIWDAKNHIFHPVKAYAGSREIQSEISSKSFILGEYILLDTVYQTQSVCLAQIGDAETQPNKWHGLAAYPSEGFSQLQVIEGTTFLSGIPLSVKGEFFGMILTKERGLKADVQRRRLEITTGIAQQVTLAIQNDKLQKEKTEQERMEREFYLARQIQETFLPEHLPVAKGWEFDALWQTAYNVGGDWYDLFRIDRYHLGLVIADVSDKGLAAALYMTVTRTLIRANVNRYSSPAALLSSVNNLLLVGQQNGMYVTAIYCVLNTKTGELIYANAGHNRPFIRRGQSLMIDLLPKGGIALGVLEDSKYLDYKYVLDRGDFLVLYTDGVTDTQSPSGTSFGEDRLMITISEIKNHSTKDFLNLLNEELEAFRGGMKLFDDITLLVAHKL